MSKMDEILNRINPNRRNPRNAELWDWVKGALAQIGEINEAYRKILENDESAPSLIAQIEQKLNSVTTEYAKLFTPDEQGKTKYDLLKEKVTEIEGFHARLLTGEGSTKAEVENAYGAIKGLYEHLFIVVPEGGVSRSDEVKKAVEDITSFHEKLIGGDTSIESRVKAAAEAIESEHSDLFGKPEGQKSKIEQVHGLFSDIKEFNRHIEDDVSPKIDRKLTSLDEIENDITTKRREVSALLSDATAKTLAEGYQESKFEYSKPKPIKTKKLSDCRGVKGVANALLHNVYAIFYNVLFRHAADFGNHILFIVPLVVVGLVFVGLHTDSLLAGDFKNAILKASFDVGRAWERIPVTLPFLWIAWYGQRNISQRKRLFEEYNHKLRVSQMYLMFTSKEYNYELSDNTELEEIMLDAIKHRPSDSLGYDETMLDKILNAWSKGGKVVEEKVIAS